MEKLSDYEVLTHLQDNELTSQRKIASRTGLSLGAVNLLLSKMVHKGLIKVEKLNARTMRYILTPQGLREKTRLTYHYVRRSYHQIMKITRVVDELVKSRQSSGTLNEVILYGPKDEVEQILKIYLKDQGLPYRVWSPDQEPALPRDDQLILTWRPEEDEALRSYSEVVNILNLV